jgi:predicted RNA-binding Zn-ribbon protein involved in translation (DUF1610 family)
MIEVTSMDETFPCPKCGQTLTRPVHAVSMQCPACKNFVIIPSKETSEYPNPFNRPVNDPTAAMYARSQAPAAGKLPSTGKAPSPEAVRTMVLLILAGGNKQEAIKMYQKMTNTSAEQAAAAVDSIERMGAAQQPGGTPVSLESMRKTRQYIILVSFLIVLGFGLAMALFVMR